MGKIEVEIGIWLVVESQIVTIVLHIEIGEVFISVSVGVPRPAREVAPFNAEIVRAAVLAVPIRIKNKVAVFVIPVVAKAEAVPIGLGRISLGIAPKAVKPEVGHCLIIFVNKSIAIVIHPVEKEFITSVNTRVYTFINGTVSVIVQTVFIPFAHHAGGDAP